MSISNSLHPKEIGHGEWCYELEEREASRGAAGEDHMVAGVVPATRSSGGRRWRTWGVR